MYEYVRVLEYQYGSYIEFGLHKFAKPKYTDQSSLQEYNLSLLLLDSGAILCCLGLI